jgi:superoxide dismutase, Cu-Zn family
MAEAKAPFLAWSCFKQMSSFELSSDDLGRNLGREENTMKILFAGLSVGFLVLAVGCQNQPANRQMKDAAITAAVKAKLAADVRLATLTNVAVTTESGNVSLRGEVETEEQKRQCEEIARSTDGVARVLNDLKVISKAPSVEANFIDSTGKLVGKATLSEESGGGVRIQLNLNGLRAGVHGIHIHEIGECKEPDFKSAGKHFNPSGKHHGADNPQGSHAGDLGNIEVSQNGSVETKLQAPEVTLGVGPNSLLRPGGTAIIIHARRDDQKSDPSGDSGEPIACGVIQTAPEYPAVTQTRK